MIMKGKMKFCILAVFGLTVAAMWFGTKEAGAFTIAEDGKYALVLNLKGSDKEVANIDGQSGREVVPQLYVGNLPVSCILNLARAEEVVPCQCCIVGSVGTWNT